ncbi:macro domain-containing protein [Patescibacteria group bacterium]
MNINYIKGDATKPTTKLPKIIVHICNDIGAWGAGFVLALSQRWAEPEAEYRKWHKEGGNTPFELGNVQFVIVENNLWVANLIGQRHINSQDDIPPIRYDAVQKGLLQVAEFTQKEGATIHMPRIGCGLAGGNWNEIELIIKETLISRGIDVFVYDLPNTP